MPLIYHKSVQPFFIPAAAERLKAFRLLKKAIIHSVYTLININTLIGMLYRHFPWDPIEIYTVESALNLYPIRVRFDN